jgi:glycosyltransferase involved in cell wall biosynthesis
MGVTLRHVAASAGLHASSADRARALQSGNAMHRPAQLPASVLICTYNRSVLLRETLESLRAICTRRVWEIVVIDNNSTDDTRRVVTDFAGSSGVPVRYVFEPLQGKSNALNTGMSHTQGDIIVFTDDDVRVGAGWLDEACGALDEDPALDYTGGPVRPLWGAPPPAWLDQTRSDLWGTLAILDYGDLSFIFEERYRVPLGVNLAVRRSLIDRIGGFHPELGRRGASLLGQEQAEFLARGRARGTRGQYVPHMQVWHHVPASRLTKRYFRRWWYWKGVSRARVEKIHRCTELGLDLRAVPYIAGVPRFVWGQIPRAAGRWARSLIAGDRAAAMRHKMLVAYSLGYIRGCWSREQLTPVAPPERSQPPAEPQPASLSR